MQTPTMAFLSDAQNACPTISAKAQQVCILAQQEDQLPDDLQHFTFVITILAVIEIIAALISLYKACMPAPKAAACLQDPDGIAMWRLRKEIRRHEGINVSPLALSKHIVTVSKTLTVEEVTTMYAEAK